MCGRSGSKVIWQQATSLFNHIRQVAALVANLYASGAFATPNFGGRGGRRGSAMVPFERAMVLSYRLSIVPVALSPAIRPKFPNECLRRSNQQGGSLAIGCKRKSPKILLSSRATRWEEGFNPTVLCLQSPAGRVGDQPAVPN